MTEHPDHPNQEPDQISSQPTEHPEPDPTVVATAALRALRGEVPAIPDGTPFQEACEEAVAVINQLAAVKAARAALRNGGLQ